MKAGYPTVHVSKCYELSKGYKCTRISVVNMAMCMRGLEREGVAVAHERSVFLLPSPDERT
jgi:hypothetical protein